MVWLINECYTRTSSAALLVVNVANATLPFSVLQNDAIFSTVIINENPNLKAMLGRMEQAETVRISIKSLL